MNSGADLKSRIAEAASKEVPAQPEEDLPDLGLDLAEHKLQHEVDTLRHELQEAKDTHKLRLGYAGKIFWLVVGWLALVAVSVLLTGWRIWGFDLSDKVLITFITSTTVNVVGLFVVVAKWMFPSQKAKSNHKNSS